MRSLKMDKRGFSLSSWIEVAMFSSLFILLVVGLFAVLNEEYDSDLGDMGTIGTLANGTVSDLSSYQSTLQQSVSQGESASSGLGVSLSTTWNIISAGSAIIWSFLTGNMIQQLAGLIGLPTIVGSILQILFVLSIGLVVLRLVLKIRP